MKSFDCIITEENGIHARPAGALVKEAMKFNSKISLFKGDRSADAKGLFSLMGLGVKSGDEVRVEITGEDEEEAFSKIKEFILKKFCGGGDGTDDGAQR